MIQAPDIAMPSDLLIHELAKAVLLQNNKTVKQTFVRSRDWQV